MGRKKTLPLQVTTWDQTAHCNPPSVLPIPPTETYPSRSSPISAHRSIQEFCDEGGVRGPCRAPGIGSAQAPINKRWAQRVDCEIGAFDTGPISYNQLGITPFGLWVKLEWKVSGSAPSEFLARAPNVRLTRSWVMLAEAKIQQLSDTNECGQH